MFLAFGQKRDGDWGGSEHPCLIFLLGTEDNSCVGEGNGLAFLPELRSNRDWTGESLGILRCHPVVSASDPRTVAGLS